MVAHNDKTRPIQLAGSKNNILLMGCIALVTFVVFSVALGMFYIIFPQRVNVLLLGIDETPPGTNLGRSDTIILTTFQPLKPYIGMLSIPRDLWVEIPGVGENRINTAHIFAEQDVIDSGPFATLNTVEHNFGVEVNYYIRFHFEGFEQVIDAMDGVEIELDQPMAGYQAGVHHLDGQRALAFVRDRTSTDDFYRMARGQLFLKAGWKQLVRTDQWERLPRVMSAMSETIDTNLPPWYWPRLILTIILVGPEGIDNKVITREFVDPFTTSGGAQVLAPDWEKIKPLLIEMFGK